MSLVSSCIEPTFRLCTVYIFLDFRYASSEMPHTTGSILTLTVLIILFVSTSSYYIITVGLRLLGWYLLRQSETRRNAVLDELAEAERKHGGGVMKKEEALVVGFFHPFWCADSKPLLLY